jgi:hypothetical protein
MSSRLFVAPLLLVLVVGGAPAQCIGDDNLVGPPGVPCCFPVGPVLPVFPSAFVPSTGACLMNCGVESQFPVGVFFTQPFQFFSDLWLCQLVIAPPLPAPPGLVLMKYARTWTEAGGGGPRQVWRFMINIDVVFSSTGAGPSPCPMPPCADLTMVPPRPVNYMGHIDYAYDCSANVWDVCYSLVHLCGYFMHGPQSTRPLPGAFAHPDRTYALAGPAPFVFGPTTGPIGFLAADSQRSTEIDLNAFPILWDSKREHAIAASLCGGSVAPCPCAGSGPTGTMWSSFTIGWSEFCIFTSVSNFIPAPLPPYLPTGMGHLALGTFGGPPGTFPGTRQLETWIGLAASADPCPTQFFSFPFHLVHGVSHHSGDLGTTFPNSNATSVTTDKFIDFENMLIPNGSAAGGASIGIGSLFISTQVWGVCLV